MKKNILLGIMFLGLFFLAGCNQKQINQNQPIGKNNTNTENKSPTNTQHPDQQNYDIMNFMEEARIYATFCNDDNKEILSTNGGGKFCDEGESSDEINRLRRIDFCGNNPEDTKWIVTNGKNKNWTIELNCKNFTDCNGGANTYCNVNGCVFSSKCDPRK